MNLRLLMVGILGFSLSGCVTQKIAVKPAYDISKIHRIAVIPFTGPGGPAVTNEFIRQLLASGFEVLDRSQPVDAVLQGTITDYHPTNKLMVYLGTAQTVTPQGQTIVMNNPVLLLSGLQVTPDNASISLPTSQMVSVSAGVGIEAQLTTTHLPAPVWLGDFSYEALDVTDATQIVVRALTHSMNTVLLQAAGRTAS